MGIASLPRDFQQKETGMWALVELRIIVGKSVLNAQFLGLSDLKMCDRKTYMVAKICVILRRDFGVDIGESSVGRIMKNLDCQDLEVH